MCKGFLLADEKFKVLVCLKNEIEIEMEQKLKNVLVLEVKK